MRSWCFEGFYFSMELGFDCFLFDGSLANEFTDEAAEVTGVCAGV